MTRPWLLQSSFTAVGLFLTIGPGSVAQNAPRPTNPPRESASRPSPEQIVLSAIRTNPVTAPYALAATWRKGAVELSGRVGTKQVHDVAIRLAIDCGVPFRDNLVIDTGEAHRVAIGQSIASAGNPGLNQTYTHFYSPSPYIYPPPLMGRLDDPFFGYVPPLISFPPWWQRPTETAPMVQPRRVPDSAIPGKLGASNAAGGNTAPTAAWKPFEVDPVKGQVEVTVDAAGQVFLRGVVASEEVRQEIENAARSVPGVTRVESQFDVQPQRVPSDVPLPPTPQPFPGQPASDRSPVPNAPGTALARANPLPKTAAPLALDSDMLTRRVINALEQRVDAADLPVRVRSSDGVVTLAGQVPTAYEAMIVYRTAQKTPGVRDIIDRLEFVVPDEDHNNPLLLKGRPEDVEPYLGSQVRRHVAELAQLAGVQVNGNLVELRGTLNRAADRDRLLAILRSIPVLHGFQLETVLTPK